MAKRIAVISSGLLVLSGWMLAQSLLGSITGTVKDPQGAVVVGAKVVATEVSTNVSREGATNGSGLYGFQDLTPGTYVIAVSAPGFKNLKSSNIVLVAASSSRFDADLAIGDQVAETVVVKATAPTLITDSAETGDLKVGEDMVRQPMQRSMLLLARLNPGTVSGSGSGMMIGGQRGAYENLTIDGISTMNNNYGGQSGPQTADQSFESVAEVKITNGNGDADTPGFASLITTTKGGTNQFHGSAFYTTDNSYFNSNGFRKHSRRPGPNLQWFGGSIGGPVWLPKIYDGHNKTFFFVTWEHRTWPLAAGNTYDLSANLPTADFGRGDFSSLLAADTPIQLTDPFNGGVPFAGNIIPTQRLSSVALALQNGYYPALPSGNSYNQNYSALVTSPEGASRYDIRIDHHFSDRDSLSSRFTRQTDPQPRGVWDQNTPVFSTALDRSQVNMFIGELHTFSPNLLNEFRLGFTRDNLRILPNHDGNAVLQQISLDLGLPVPTGTRGFPSINFADGVEGLGNSPSAVQIGQEYSLMDNVSWQKGQHGIKAGILLRYGKPQSASGNGIQQFGSFSFGGTNFGTGFGYADFLLGIPSTESLNNNVPNVYIRKTDTGLFVQDQWHATSKLTMTFGLRWEYFMPPVDRNSRRVNFDPSTGNMVVASARTVALLNPELPTVLTSQLEIAKSGFPGNSLLSGRKTNWAPRFGFAYLLSKGTVIRGGYGFYFSPAINALQDSLENPGLFGVSINNVVNSFTNNAPLYQFPSPFSTLPSLQGSTCTEQCLSVSGTDPHLKTPTSQQWNLTVERDLGRSLVARVAYRGFMNTQLPITNDLTLPRVYGDARNYPLYTQVLWTNSGGIQKMNALDLSLERKFTSGLTFQTAYTLAKNRSDTVAGDGGSSAGDSPSNPYNRAADMGNVYFTPRHRMVNNIVWDIPFGKGQRFGSGVAKPVDYALGGWELSAINVIQSGYFLTPIYDGPSDLMNNGSPLRPNCSGSLTVPHPSPSEWFNTSAFSVPDLGTYGNCGVGVIQGPSRFGFNFAVHKFFNLHENVRLKFEANMMNAFNHPVLNVPDMDLSDSGFGAIGVSNRLYPKRGDLNALTSSVSSTNGERHIWMGLRLEF